MRKAILIGCLMLLPLLAGCTVSDMLFDVFGDGYTGGGYTRGDRKSHYDQQRQASDHYHPWAE